MVEDNNNMIRTVTFLEKDYTLLQNNLFKDGKEQAAYLLCNISHTENEMRFLVKEVIPVDETYIVSNHQKGIYYTCDSYIPVVSKAKKNNLCFIIVHCHPNGLSKFSNLDNREEIKLLKYVYNRVTNNRYHGSIVFSNPNSFSGRILDPKSDTYNPITKIRILGHMYRFINSFYTDTSKLNNINIFNRNILAFGEDLLNVLHNINVGVVGCGGTGSAVIEQLCRLGVGKITLVDDDIFDDTNVTRVHGSMLSDKGIYKVLIMKKMIEKIGLDTKVISIKEKLDNRETAKKLRDCEIIFSCLDYTNFARAILNQLCISYYIPLIDMGIKFDSRGGKLNDIFGRIDIIKPNESCLFCRNIINSEMIAAEQMKKDEYLRLKSEGYAPELPKDKVQAIPYNTLVGSYAITEMIQLLTNFKGKSHEHTIYRFIANKTSNIDFSNEQTREGCLCTSDERIGCGDVDPFLLLSWGA